MTAGQLPTTQVKFIPQEHLLPLLRANPGLHSRMRQPSFFCSADWFEAVLAESPPGAIFALAVSRNSGLIGLLPLERVRNRFGGTDLRFLGHKYYPDPLGFICPAQELEECVHHSLRFLQGRSDWSRMTLDFLLPEEAALWGPDFTHQAVAPRLAIGDNLDSILARFEKKARYKIRAAVRNAEKAGARLDIPLGPQSRAKSLDALFHLHAARSSRIGRNSSISDDQTKRLHHRLVRQCPSALLFSLSISGSPTAVLYGFLQDKYFAYYQVAHDPDYSHLSPGSVLLTLVVDWCCRNDVSTFDFLQGDEAYKFRWATDVQPLARAMLVADRPIPKILTRVEIIGTNVMRRLRRLL